jgi:hypothetical protein
MKAAVVKLPSPSGCVAFIANLVSIAMCDFVVVFPVFLPSRICKGPQ